MAWFLTRLDFFHLHQIRFLTRTNLIQEQVCGFLVCWLSHPLNKNKSCSRIGWLRVCYTIILFRFASLAVNDFTIARSVDKSISKYKRTTAVILFSQLLWMFLPIVGKIKGQLCVVVFQFPYLLGLPIEFVDVVIVEQFPRDLEAPLDLLF